VLHSSLQLGDLVEMNSDKGVRSVYLVTKIKDTQYSRRVIEIENINGKETRMIGEWDLYNWAIKL
jgi:hypothetical protein